MSPSIRHCEEPQVLCVILYDIIGILILMVTGVIQAIRVQHILSGGIKLFLELLCYGVQVASS